jgi:hypothetical protein
MTSWAASRAGSAVSLLCVAWVLAWTMSARSAVLSENFATDPAARGWKSFGDTNLFHWDSGSQNLSVTWDSSHTNSYFYLPLGTLLGRQDDFSVAFDLQLQDFEGGINPAKPSSFELAIGFLNIVDATNPTFLRAAYSPNLVEFDFFPDTGFGPTIWPSFWSTNSILSYNGSSDYTILDLPGGVMMHVAMAYTASNHTLVASITTNGFSIGQVHKVKQSPSFTDYRVGAFAIESYSDAGQNPQFGGSLLAHGFVDNVQITVPPPPVQDLAGGLASNQWQVTFLSQTNWSYTLIRSVDLQAWQEASPPATGNGATLLLSDRNSIGTRAFYRVRADRLP